MATDEKIDLVRFLKGKADVLRQPQFLKAAAEIMVSSIIRSFQVGGRTSGDPGRPFEGGAVKWAPVNSAYAAVKQADGKSSDNILLYRGRLRNSVQWQVTGAGLELGSNVTYAAIQQFGGDVRITDKSRAYFRYRAATAKSDEAALFWIRLSHTKKDHMRIPARAFITVQREDYEDLSDIAVTFMSK